MDRQIESQTDREIENRQLDRRIDRSTERGRREETQPVAAPHLPPRSNWRGRRSGAPAPSVSRWRGVRGCPAWGRTRSWRRPRPRISGVGVGGGREGIRLERGGENKGLLVEFFLRRWLVCEITSISYFNLIMSVGWARQQSFDKNGEFMIIIW